MDTLGESAYARNNRFQIAKGQIDQLFMKWLSYSTTDKLVNVLLSEINNPGQALGSPPSPNFVSAIPTPHSPKGSGGMKSHTPPRSPHGEKFGRTLSPKTSGSLFEMNTKDRLPQKNLANNFGSAAAQTSPFSNDLESPSQSSKSRDTSNYQGSAASGFNQQTQQNTNYNFNAGFSKTDNSALKKMQQSYQMS